MSLDRVRCVALLEEIAFVAERLNDPLVHERAHSLQEFVTRRIQDPLWRGTITVEGD